jgi:hypothetical protein
MPLIGGQPREKDDSPIAWGSNAQLLHSHNANFSPDNMSPGQLLREQLEGRLGTRPILPS